MFQINSITEVWKAFIRPPRYLYNEEDMGPETFYTNGGDILINRVDLTLKNKQGIDLQCSYFIQESMLNNIHQLPCIVYCHGNSGSRLDAWHLVEHVLPHNVVLFAFDFGGAGISSGEYITLGLYEQYDLQAVIKYIRSNLGITRISLWGRSMGAVTSILYGSSDPDIYSIVVDSPFSSLNELVYDLADQRMYIPKFIVSPILSIIKSVVKDKIKASLDDIKPLESIQKIKNIPMLFGVATNDELIKSTHTQQLFKALPCEDKQIEYFEGTHNSERPQHFINIALNYIINNFQRDLTQSHQNIKHYYSQQQIPMQHSQQQQSQRGQNKYGQQVKQKTTMIPSDEYQHTKKYQTSDNSMYSIYQGYDESYILPQAQTDNYIHSQQFLSLLNNISIHKSTPQQQYNQFIPGKENHQDLAPTTKSRKLKIKMSTTKISKSQVAEYHKYSSHLKANIPNQKQISTENTPTYFSLQNSQHHNPLPSIPYPNNRIFNK